MTDGRLSYHGGAHVEQLRGNRDIPASNSTCAQLADPYETDGVANIDNVNNALKAATPWFSIYQVPEPALAAK